MNSFSVAHSRSVLRVRMSDLSLIPSADQPNNRAILWSPIQFIIAVRSSNFPTRLRLAPTGNPQTSFSVAQPKWYEGRPAPLLFQALRFGWEDKSEGWSKQE